MVEGAYTVKGVTSGGGLAPSFDTKNPNGDIVLGKEKKKWWPVVVGILVAVLVVVGIVVGIKLYNDSRVRLKEEANELYSLIGWTSHITRCSLVVNDAENINTTVDEFQTYLDDCKNNTKIVENNLTDLKNRSSDAGYIELYNDLDKLISEKIVLGDELEKELAIYKAWHDWHLVINSEDYYQTEAEVDEMMAPLLETGDERLISYAKGWAARRKALNFAFLMADSLGGDEYVSDFNMKLEDLNNYVDKFEIDSLVRLDDETDSTDLKNKLLLFKDYVEERL